MSLGLWLHESAEIRASAVAADRLGYSQIWCGEMAKLDAFALATYVGQSLRAMDITIGPLPISVRTPATMALGAYSVATLTGRNVHLAIGSANRRIRENWHGRESIDPSVALGEAVQILTQLLQGHISNFHGGQLSSVGFKLKNPVPRCSIAVAALGPSAIRAAAQFADRIVLNMVTPAIAARITDDLARIASKSGRTPPLVTVWIPAAATPTRAAILQLRHAMIGYLSAPGYEQIFNEAGFGREVALANSGATAAQLDESVPDNLVWDIACVGDENQIERRIAEYHGAGVDDLCVLPATADDWAGVRTLTVFAERSAITTPKAT